MGIMIFIILAVGVILYASSIDKDRVQKMNGTTLNGFNTKIRKEIHQHSFLISEDYKKLAILNNGIAKIVAPQTLDIEQLKECQVIQDGSTIIKNAIGRAVVGGVIAGGAGAIVGTNSGKQIKQVERIELRFLTKNLNNPIVRIAIYERNGLININSKDIIEGCEDLIATINMLINSEHK